MIDGSKVVNTVKAILLYSALSLSIKFVIYNSPSLSTSVPSTIKCVGEKTGAKGERGVEFGEEIILSHDSPLSRLLLLQCDRVFAPETSK